MIEGVDPDEEGEQSKCGGEGRIREDTDGEERELER